MKRTLALMLALCMLLPLVACGSQPTAQPAEAAAQVTYTKEQYQQAAVAAAMGYYHKNPYTQYDARNLSSLGKWAGPMRNNHGEAPEYASADQDHYSQCTDFVMDVYIEAFHYRMFHDIMQPSTDANGEIGSMAPDTPGIVFYWTPKSELAVNDMAKQVLELLEPGDMLATNGKNTGESVGSGHAMLCVGDVDGDGQKDMMHCWGKPLSYGSPSESPRNDYFETDGAIYLQSAKDLLITTSKKYDGEPKWNIRSDSHVANYLMVFRPTSAADFTNQITESTLSRMQYDGIEIDRRTVGMTKYNDLTVGQSLTFEVEIINNGKSAYTALPVSETVPEGVTLDTASVTENGKVEGKRISWSLDVPAGESKVLSYTVTVDAPRGTLITFPKGTVASIPTREITLQVGGAHLTTEQLTAIRNYAETQNGFTATCKDSTDLSFVTAFYQQVLGIELDLPKDLNEYIDAKFDHREQGDETLLIPKESFSADHPQWAGMEMYKHLGGLSVYMDEGLDNSKRLLELKEEFYQPGDIFLTVWGKNLFHANNPDFAGVYLYLGEGKVLTAAPDGTLLIDTYENTMNCLLRNSIFDVFRPTLAFDNINAK